MGKNILCLMLFCIGTGIIWYTQGFIIYLGIFTILWANNISLMENVYKIKAEDKSILKILFGDDISKERIEEIMSQKMKVSDK